MTPEAFNALFDSLRGSAFRLEALPRYQVGGMEEERFTAFLEGRALPDRSVRTNAWVARVAVSTVIKGVSWTRLRIVDRPLTDFQRYQLESYRESQAVGEQVTFLYRDQIAQAGPDFWLIDAGTASAAAVVMGYDEDGRWLSADLVTDPEQIAALDAHRTTLQAAAAPLNEFLAATHG